MLRGAWELIILTPDGSRGNDGARASESVRYHRFRSVNRIAEQEFEYGGRRGLHNPSNTRPLR